MIVPCPSDQSVLEGFVVRHLAGTILSSLECLGYVYLNMEQNYMHIQQKMDLSFCFQDFLLTLYRNCVSFNVQCKYSDAHCLQFCLLKQQLKFFFTKTIRFRKFSHK